MSKRMALGGGAWEREEEVWEQRGCRRRIVNCSRNGNMGGRG